MPYDPFLNQSQDSGGPQMPSLKAGQWLFQRRFQLVEQVGSGGMGVVWLAIKHPMESKVALKFLPSLLVQQDREMQRLKDEVNIGKDLRHDHIVATYDLEQEDGIAAIVMEYVEGKNLKELLEAQQRGFFEPEEVATWIKHLAEALTYLHEKKGRTHRDVKPANIKIDSQGSAKLLDFGLSHRIRESLSRHTQAAAAQMGSSGSGTLAYMSPQQLTGKPAHPADDIYSLGATLYELLTGSQPFFRGGQEAVTHQIKHEQVTPLMERRQELKDEGLNAIVGVRLPPRVGKAVKACLAKEREARPANALSLAQALGAPGVHVRPSGLLKAVAALLVVALGAWAYVSKSKEIVKEVPIVDAVALAEVERQRQDAAQQRQRADEMEKKHKEEEQKRLAAEATAKQAQEVAAKQAQEAAAKAKPPQPPPGELLYAVTSNIPETEVWAGGEKMGATPIKLRMTPGTYSLEIRSPPWPTKSFTVSVGDGLDASPPRLDVNFAWGELQVESTPAGATCTLKDPNGNSEGVFVRDASNTEGQMQNRTWVTPWAKQRLVPGVWKVSFEKPGYQSGEKEIVISEGQSSLLSIQLKRELQKK